jgi:two-component system nitrate/nitrite sensor histidine kinase NarX
MLEVMIHREAGKEEEETPQPLIPLDQSAGLQEIVRSGRPLLVSDLRSGSEEARAWIAHEHPVLRRLVGRGRCWLGVPLAVKDRVIGVLRLSHAEPGAFTDHDAELALAFARHVALAMENARLYEQAGEMAAVEERQRLARDLHDAVSQTLFSASLTADVLPRLWDQDPSQVRPLLEELAALTRGARAEMRTLLWELRPQTLLQANFEQLVQQLAEAMAARVRIRTHVTVECEARTLPPDAQVGLYRIVQETLNNIMKHAGATHPSIRLTWLCAPAPAAPSAAAGPAGVELEIEDDGRGFAPEAVSWERLGLKIMRERASGIGARLTIESRPGSGTRVHVAWQAT